MPHSDINGSLSKTRKYAPLGFTDWPPSPRIPGLPFRRRGGGLAPGPAPAVPPPTQRVRSLGHAHSGPRHRQPHHPLSSSVLQARAARSSPAPPQAAQCTPGPAPRSSPRTPPLRALRLRWRLRLRALWPRLFCFPAGVGAGHGAVDRAGAGVVSN